MTEQDDKKKTDQETAVPKDEADGSGKESDTEEKQVRNLEISDKLRAALEEAETSVSRHEEQRKKPQTGQTSAPTEDTGGSSAEVGEAGEDSESPSDVEIDVEDPEEEEFDPNKVDEYEQEAPPPAPTPAEMELKMQVLELRQKLRDKETELEKKLKEMKQNAEQARHIQKQFESYKQRANKEKADWFNYGHEPILKELLAVKDNLERAVHHAEDSSDINSLRDGVKLTLRQFNSILEKFGVSPIKAQGEPFNPEYHQAMMQMEDNSVPGGTIIDEHQQGYILKDRLLRPSMVTVSKRTQPEQGPPEDGKAGENDAETSTDPSGGKASEDTEGPGRNE